MTSLEAALHDADAAADRVLAGRHIPGVVYGVMADGRLAHVRGIGTLRVGEDEPPDADSVFRIASMTKSFTAATIVQLRDEGRLGFDDPIGRHVPELADLRGPTADSPPVTVRHLLTMSSGLATDDPWGDRQQGLELAAFAELLRGGFSFSWPTGTRFEYSNLGYGILGRLITNVTGMEYRDAVRDRLLAPLGMIATTYLEAEVPAERLARGYLWRDDAYLDEPSDPYGALASMGGLFTSVRDLARWVGFFLEAFPPRDEPEGSWPLSRASRREMQQVHRDWGPELETPGLDADPSAIGGGYALGLFIIDDTRWGRIVGHSGGYPGFGSNMRWHAASGLGVIVLANHRYAPASLVAREIITTLLTAEAVPARRIQPTAATTAARVDVERLIDAWDDALAARLFSMNVELDEPLERRRAELERLRTVHGALRSDPDLAVESDTPAALRWWLAGERGGRVEVDLLLSPERPPRVQALGITSVPEPSEALVAVASAVVAALGDPEPTIPDGLELEPGFDRAKLAGILRIAGARFGRVTLGPAVGGDGARTATWRLPAGAATLVLAVERDPATGIVHALSLIQRPPVAPPHAD